MPKLGASAVKVPSYVDHYVLPANAFPQSLWDETEAYLSSRAAKETVEVDDLLADDDLFGNEDGGRTHLRIRPSTAQLVRYRVRQFASALVIKKLKQTSDIGSLATLVDPATVAKGLGFFIERVDGKRENSQIYGITTDLLMIAEVWVRSSASDIQKLRTISKKVRPRHEGLPTSAKRSLAPFRDVQCVKAFLTVADRIVRDAEKEKKVDRVIANRVAAALWIKIAQRAPLRISNLLSTHLEKNVVRSPGKDGSVALVYPPEQVKNQKAIEVPLPKATAQLLNLYITRYRPALVDGPSPWLFPAPAGKFKRLNVMSVNIQRLMREYIGFSINPHSFRHVAAKLYLSVHPGDYERVQLLLGHRSRETTVRYYCDLQQDEAFRHFDHVLLGLSEDKNKKGWL